MFVLHASPGSKLLFDPHVADAVDRRIRLIGHDRAGYGGSTPKPGRVSADDAGDVRAIADALGIDRFAVWGNSTGGARALACAALLPDRVVAASCIAGVAPYPADGLDWFAGVDAATLADFQLFLADPVAWRRKVVEDVRRLRAATLAEMNETLFGGLSDADRASVTPELVRFAHAQLEDGFAPGPEGYLDDQISDLRPWGFDLGTIRVPVQVWHGKEDWLIPYSHGQWLAAHVPHAEVHFEEREGHVSLFANRIPEVHAWLLQHF